MPDASQILADEFGLLKGFQVTNAAANDAEVADDKMRSLATLVQWWIPGPHEDLYDPFRYLQKALNDIIQGRDRLGVSVYELAKSGDTFIYEILLALTYVRSAILDLYHPDCAGGSLEKWPAEWLGMLRPAGRSEHRLPVHYGYRIDNFTVGCARDLLGYVAERSHPCDLRRLVAVGCVQLFDRCLQDLEQWEEGDFEGEELRYRWTKTEPIMLEFWETWVQDVDAGRW